MDTNEYILLNINNLLTEKDDIENRHRLSLLIEEYSCPINQDVQNFLKYQSIHFAKSKLAITYFILSATQYSLLGYFALSIKPITLYAKNFSNKNRRIISHMGTPSDINSDYFLISAYLIAQLGKNYNQEAFNTIKGKDLLDIALKQINRLQFLTGGAFALVETYDNQKLLNFYKENGFVQFNVREPKSKHKESVKLVQMFRML